MKNNNLRLFELEPSWEAALHDELQQPYLSSLAAFVQSERVCSPHPIFPPKELVFHAFWKTPFHDVKVLIMGQDPYHGLGQAHGLSFSVPVGLPPPPSLQNIFKELATDLNTTMPSHGCLNGWTEQGVMLLNATLTVRQGEPMSHHGKGWERLTDAVVAKLNQRKEPVAFVLWGKSAQEKFKNITANPQHLVLKAAHPSPFSAHSGFFGCQHFSKINEWLKRSNRSPIDWQIK